MNFCIQIRIQLFVFENVLWWLVTSGYQRRVHFMSGFKFITAIEPICLKKKLSYWFERRKCIYDFFFKKLLQKWDDVIITR